MTDDDFNGRLSSLFPIVQVKRMSSDPYRNPYLLARLAQPHDIFGGAWHQIDFEAWLLPRTTAVDRWARKRVEAFRLEMADWLRDMARWVDPRPSRDIEDDWDDDD